MEHEPNHFGTAVRYLPKSKTFQSESYRKPQLKNGEILVKISLCTICGSDLHTYSGRRPTADTGCVLGHEIIGTIEEWNGTDSPKDYFGNPLNKGQRVTWSLVASCGDCFYCKDNLPQKCQSKFKYGHDESDHQPTGGLGQHCVLKSGTAIFPIKEGLPDTLMCPANCATATVCGATRLVEETHPIKNTTILVIGAGMLGLTAAAYLKERGANILVVEPNLERRKIAREFGASECFESCQTESLQTKIQELTQHRGADIAFDFSGNTEAITSSLEHLRIGGCLLLAGSVFRSPQIKLNPEVVVRQMLTIRGLHNYPARDLAEAIHFLSHSKDTYPFEKLVSKVFPLDQSALAFDYATEKAPIRIAVKP